MQDGPTLEEKRAEVMFARGVPPEYANAIESWALRGRFSLRPKKYSFRERFFGLLSAMVVIAIVCFIMWLLNMIPAQQARQAAEETGASLMFFIVGMGPLLVLPAAVFLYFFVQWKFENADDGRHRAALNLWDGLGLPGFYARPIAGAVHADSTDAENFLIRFRRRDLRNRMAAFLVLTAATFIAAISVTIAEANTFLIAGPRGIVQQTFLGEAKRITYSLGNVVRVTTDCYKTTGKSARWRAEFKLHTKDNHDFEIGDGVPVDGNRLGALEAIAAALPSGVQYEPADDLASRVHACATEAFFDQPDALRRTTLLLKPPLFQAAPSR